MTIIISNYTNIFREVDRIIEQAIHEGVFPGATLWVGLHGETIKCSAYGRTSDKAYGKYIPVDVTTKTLYDLASLTKVVATTWAIMHLVERGLLKLSDAVSRYVPQLESNRLKASITIWHILTHTSGLPAPLGLHRHYQGRDSIIQGICNQNLVFSPGTQCLYCDAGFILLGDIVRILSSFELDEYTNRYLFKKLGMSDTMFNPQETIWDRVAPTEYMSDRGGIVHGKVHDENAWAMNGIAGHAGLFSTVEDLAKFCNMLLEYGMFKGKRVLEINSIMELKAPQNGFPDESFGLGWMINRPYFMGLFANNNSFGHTGFTGTSIIINAQIGFATVLLSNRVCPTRDGPDISTYRRMVADALSKLCSR